MRMWSHQIAPALLAELQLSTTLESHRMAPPEGEHTRTILRSIFTPRYMPNKNAYVSLQTRTRML